MAIEDGWVFAEHLARLARESELPRWDAALAAYEAVRVEHCRRVQSTARSRGALWHLDGEARLQRNAIMRERAVDDYAFTDWIYGPTALGPDQEPPMFTRVPLASATVDAAARAAS